LLFLLDRNVKTVKWNGIPLHEADSAIVKEEQNGDFTLNVRYPITDSGIYQLIKEDMLIKAPAPVLGPQLFRIKKPIENNDHLEIQAYHITDDVMKRSVKPLKVVNLGCAMALSQMVQNAKADIQDFSFTSDIWDKRTFNTIEDDTLYSILLDGKHSIVGTWEGELVRDNFALTVKKNRGTNRGVIITTHKNLKSYQRTKDSQNVATRIYAKSTFKSEGAEQETTLKVTVDSPLINSYPYVNEKEYENNNAKTVDELRQWAEAKFKNEGIDKSSDAIKIEAYELDGQIVHIGDTVNLKSRKHNIDIFKKAIAYEFNALTEEYISLTFDDKPGVGGSRVSNGISSVANEILEIGNSAQEIAIERALRNADKAFDAEFEKQKSLINDGIEQAKAKAEQVKSEINQSIEQKLQQTKSEVVEKVKRDFNQGLANANAEIGKVKQNLTNLQSSTEANIKQVKSDLAGISTQQTAYEQSNTQNIARITGQLGDKASKAEVKQEAGKIREEISQISVGGRNYIRHYDFDGLLPFNIAGSEWTFERVQDPTAKSGWALKATNVKGNDGGIHKPLVDLRGVEWQGKQMTWSVDVKSNRTDIKLYNIGFEAGGNITTGVQLSDKWQRVSKAFIVKFERFWSFVVYGFGWRAGDVIWIRDPQLEDGNIATTPKPALEDTDEQITAARATFEKTAEGLNTDMTAVKSYVADDSKRREQLEQYTRTETARSTEALRKQVSESYVAKSQYTEDVRGITRRFEELNIGSPNLVLNGAVELGDRYWGGTDDKLFTNRTHVFYKNGKKPMFVIDTNEPNIAYLQNVIFNKLKKNTTYTLSFTGFMSGNVSGFRVLVGLLSDTDNVWKDAINVFHQRLSPIEAQRFSVTFNSGNYDGFSIRFDNMGSSNGISATVWISEIDVYEGTMKRAYQPAPENNQNYADTKLAEYKQTVDGEFKKLQSSVGEMVKKTDINITPGQISFGTGKVVNGKTIASLFVQNPESMEAITKLMRITGDLIVDGSITGRNLAANTITTAHLAAGAVTTEVLAADAVTAAELKVDYALVRKLTADDALLNNLVAKQAFINKLSTIDFSATQIKGGLLKSLNGNTSFDLSSGTLEFYTDDPAIRRVTGGFPNQFVKFATGSSNGTKVGVTVIGSNRWGSESSNDGGFVGIRAWNGNGVDSIDVVGDAVRLASSAYENADGWVVSTTGKLQIYPRRQQDRRESVLQVGDVWLYLENSGTYYSSLHGILQSIANRINSLIDNVELLHHNKTTEHGYSYSIPSKLTI
jgi:phage minor structural protein